MTHVKKVTIFTGIALILVTLAILLYFKLYIFSFLPAGKPYLAQYRLLCKTDYKLLLKACRELPIPIQNPENPMLGIKYSAKDISQNPPAGMSNISIKVITSLNPKLISVYDTGLVIFFMGDTSWSFGISAYSEEYKGPIPESLFGDRELIPDLWYYDEHCRYDPNYINVINKLIKKKTAH